MQQNNSDLKRVKRKKVSIYTRRLKDGEVVPMLVDRSFKKVFADEKHLERLNYLLSTVLNREVKVIRIINNELIGITRKIKKRAVDLVCEVKVKVYVILKLIHLLFGQKKETLSICVDLLEVKIILKLMKLIMILMK